MRAKRIFLATMTLLAITSSITLLALLIPRTQRASPEVAPPPSPASARDVNYCRKFEAGQPTPPSFAQVPSNQSEAAAIERILKPAGTGSVQQILERANLDSLPPRVAWFYLPFRGYEQPNAEESNRRAASNLLRYIGLNTGIGNPYVDLLEKHTRRYATFLHLGVIISDNGHPMREGERETLIAQGVARVLRGGFAFESAALEQSLQEMANRYATSGNTLSNTQYCFLVALGEKPDAVVNYVMDIENPMSGPPAEAYRRMLMESYRRYQNEAILYPSMTFLEYALKR